MENRILGLYAESQLHAGKGSDVGIIDLPIQRERTTGFPIIQGIKGAIRASGLVENVDSVFGSWGDGDTPGQVAFSEAKTLAFPVRHVKQLFVWVSCPLILSRVCRLAYPEEENAIPQPEAGNALVSHANLLNGNGQKAVLEEWEIPARVETRLSIWAERLASLAPGSRLKAMFADRLVIVDDSTFSQIVTTSTEVIPRIRIGKNGVVEKGALWYEEYLPQDTILYTVLREAYVNGKAKGLLEKVVAQLDQKYIVVGGNETVGKGLVFLRAWGR